MALRLSMLLCAVALMAAPSLSAQAEVSSYEGTYRFGGVTYPSSADTFRVFRTARWPDPSLGVALSYLSPAFKAELTVYVYPSDQTLTAEFDEALAELQTYTQQNREGVEVTIEETGVVDVGVAGDARFDGHLATTTLRQGSSAHVSLLYLFEKDGWFIKYRISYERSIRTLMEPRVSEFLTTTLAEIVLPAPLP